MQNKDSHYLRNFNANRSDLVRPRKATVNNSNFSDIINHSDGSMTVTVKSRNVELNGIKIKYDAEGFPDLKPFLYSDGINSVKMELTGSRTNDFAKANQIAGFGSKAVDTPDNFTWHHNQELGLMELVQTNIHSIVPHTGGVSIWQKAFGIKYK